VHNFSIIFSRRKNHLIGLFLTFEELQSTCDARCHPTLVCAQAGILITPALPFDQGFSVSITSVEVAVYIVCLLVCLLLDVPIPSPIPVPRVKAEFDLCDAS